MSDNDRRGLRRNNPELNLPASVFDELPPEEKREFVKRMAEQDLATRGTTLEKVAKSKVAKHDIDVAIDTVNRLDHEGKIYSKTVRGETGSGSYELKVRGGDTKFIVPIMVVVGLIIVGLVLVLASK